MEPVIRAFTIYMVLLILFRLSGKRTLAQVTPFDMILLLIVSEATQNYMVRQDDSFVNAALLITTLIATDVVLSLLKRRSRRLSRILDNEAVVIARDGRLIEKVARRERVEEDDVMHAARCSMGIDRMEDVAYAVLETDGQISVIPKRRPE